ncbi:hypothetical protein F4561_005105 [Lipingzhangella halophila]|uniref:Peptide chain release factor 1 n=1 Tax=Lipingzhangella halophila TaxID=1783352 RepID=A0A7W7RLN5_9ACTN|nr:hypothetical protein [Lipingzhangella halophila]MBB4934285.1 hypothetical protein [Lipingzhangella halophila]
MEPLYRASGPVASVALDTTRTTEDAAHEIALRWRRLREDLAGQGADTATLEALDRVVGGTKGIPGPQGEALFAAGGEILGAYTLPRPPSADRAVWLPIPDTTELVTELDDWISYVVAAVDREGADIYGYPPHGGPTTERHFSGATLHIQKVRGGYYANKIYHRRSELVWWQNAAGIAEEVEAAANEVRADVVFAGGDERARGMLREHLSERTQNLLIELSGGSRADAGAMADLRQAVDEGVRETAAALRSGLVLDFNDDLKRDGRAVQGLSLTVEVLRTAQAQKLLMNAGGDRPELWAAADDPMDLAHEHDMLVAPSGAFTAPASAVLLRAATASGATFTRLDNPGDAADGVGAMLRFTMET